MKSDLRAYEPVDTFFALKSADLRRARDDRRYLALSLADKSGQINGYLWEEPEDAADRLRGTTYVRVSGLTKVYNGSLMLAIERIRVAGDDEVDVKDFIETVPGGIDLWMERLLGHVELIEDRNCLALVRAFLADQLITDKLKISPAGLSIHHNYAGGLLEHTTNTMSHALYISGKYPALLDKDLMLTGSFLHDMGKIKEISAGAAGGYTTEGKLLGHISLGFAMAEGKIDIIKGFPTDLGLLIKHMILSHHGSLEFGSPVRPKTPEALALHFIENTDAKMNHFYCFLRDVPQDAVWSNFDKSLNTEICMMRFRKETNELLSQEV
ncbi:MAG: HD domain-containing protein [Nitrospiraceae bacterium]|nr:HD domain-containing protein [Nitrospiraceae bacterium]